MNITMNETKKIYLDNNHLIDLLDCQKLPYQRLAEVLKQNNDKFKIFISDMILLEQSNVFRKTLINRAENARDIAFSYLRSHKTIVQMELNHYFHSIEIVPETDNYFKVIKFPEPWHFSSKQKKWKFHQLLKVLPEKSLPPKNDSRYTIFNDKRAERLAIKDYILAFHKNNNLIIAQNNLTYINEFTCPSLFFYLASWCYKDENSTKVISRNDAFDSAHCAYIPYVDIFVTDSGNAHVAKQAVKKFNKYNQDSIQTKIFSKCEELLKLLDL